MPGTNLASLPQASPVTPAPAPRRFAGRRTDTLVEVVVTAAGFVGIAAIGLILVFVAREAIPLFLGGEAHVDFARLVLPQPWREGRPDAFVWQPTSDVPKVSLWPLILGTLKVTSVAIAIAVPLGVAAAMFSSEFAPRWLRELLKPAAELLAGVPSVVLGFFALTVLASALQDTLDLPYRLNALVAGVAMAAAIVPIVFTMTEDSLLAVPRTLREASYALGATRWQTALRVVVPGAAPGIVGACVIAFGRAIGETMIVLMASGNAAIVSGRLTDSARTLSATIAAEMGEVAVGSMHFSLLFFLGVLLFFFNLALNATAGAWIRSRMRRREGPA